MPAGDVWGNSWLSAWGVSWRQAAEPEPEPEVTSNFTSAGRAHGATQWAYKTLSEIEREKKAALKAARRVIKIAVSSGTTDQNAILQLAKTEVRERAAPIVDDLAPRLAELIRIALIRKQFEDDEDDLEVLLLAI